MKNKCIKKVIDFCNKKIKEEERLFNYHIAKKETTIAVKTRLAAFRHLRDSIQKEFDV